MSFDFYGRRPNGTVIMLRDSHPRSLNMANTNCIALLKLLALPVQDQYGEADIHTVRRAIIKAKALLGSRDPEEYAPLSEAYVQDRLTKLSVCVETLGGMGASIIYWA